MGALVAVGGIVGVVMRLTLHSTQQDAENAARRVRLRGHLIALAMSIVTGGMIAGGADRGAATAFLAGVLTTFCLFTNAALARFTKHRANQTSILAAAGETAASVGVTVFGVAVGLLTAGALG